MRYTDKTRFVQRDDRVEHIEYSEDHIKLRTILFFIAVAIAVFALARFVVGLLGRDPGWKQIELRHNSEASAYAKEYVLNYYVAESGSAYKAEMIELESAYTEALEAAKKDYDLGPVNASPNEEIKVSGRLYTALKKLDEAGDRKLFLAPVYDIYRQIFYSQNDDEAKKFDPLYSQDAAERVEELKRFFADPEHVRLIFGENNTVTLYVSDEYLDYAREHNTEKYIDLYWMENSLVVDSVAEAMMAKGFYEGKFASYDGYSRYFSESEGYAQVIMRNYPDRSLDMDHFYVYGDGTIRHCYISEVTGLPLSVPDGYGENIPGNKGSCFEIMLNLIQTLTKE